MLTVLFDWEDVVHHEYTFLGRIITNEYYLSVLCQLRDAIWWKQPQLLATGDWQLHHDNVPTHSSSPMPRFLVKRQMTQVTQHPYRQDLASCDFWLFPKLKSPLKGNKFQNINEIQENTTGQLREIPTKDFAVFSTVEETWELCEVPRWLLWTGLRHHHHIYKFFVSCTFNKGFCFS